MTEGKKGNVPLKRAVITDLVVRRALQLFEQEPARRWTVTELARHLGVSRPSLGRRFGQALGKAPLSVLRDVRVRRVAELLRTTDDGLAKIAFEVGYSSEFALSRAFTKSMKIRPGHFRALYGVASPIRMAA